MTAAEAVHALSRRAAGWAVRRALTPNAVTGLSLALAVCAAAWFTAGTRSDDVRGAVLLCGCYLAARGARRLAGPSGGGLPPAVIAAGPVMAEAGLLARVCSAAGECAVIAGLAVGADTAGWPGSWPAAITVVILISVRETIGVCYRGTAASGALRRRLGQLVAMPAGGRALLIVIAAPAWGARETLLVLLAWSVIAVTYAAFGRAPRPRPRQTTALAASPSRAATTTVLPDGRTALAALLTVPEPAAAHAAGGRGWGAGAARPPRRLDPTRPDASRPGKPWPDAVKPAGLAGLRAGPPTAVPAPGTAATAARAAPAPGPATPASAPGPATLASAPSPAGNAPGGRRGARHARAVGPLLACRDDGPAALWVGQLVRGNLIPLPPALAGAAAAAMLALLGLRDLPGSILLTPLAVMLLAAPGSGHPHDGRLDWLVPAVLQTGQYIYIATLGYASDVPGPVTFVLCAVIAAWYADLACRSSGRHRLAGLACPAGAGRQALASGLGWEGRMLAVGLGAILGIATVACLALTAYLVVLICWRLMTSCPAVAGGDRR